MRHMPLRHHTHRYRVLDKTLPRQRLPPRAVLCSANKDQAISEHLGKSFVGKTS
jgi:hypothetical protein